MGVLGERPDEAGGGGRLADRGLRVELDERRCAACGRLLHPWEQRCPDDGGVAVAPSDLRPGPDPLLARLLAEEASAGPDAVAAPDGDRATDPGDGPASPAQ